MIIVIKQNYVHLMSYSMFNDILLNYIFTVTIHESDSFLEVFVFQRPRLSSGDPACVHGTMLVHLDCSLETLLVIRGPYFSSGLVFIYCMYYMQLMSFILNMRHKVSDNNWTKADHKQ